MEDRVLLSAADIINFPSTTSLSGFGDPSSGQYTSYYAQSFVATAAVADSLTFQLDSSSGEDATEFRVLIADTTESGGHINPIKVLFESEALSKPTGSVAQQFTVSLGALNLTPGTTYAWILDGFSTRDGSVGASSVAANGTYSEGHFFFLNAFSGDRATHFSSDWSEFLSYDLAFNLTFIDNQVPVADAGGPYAIQEGQSLTLNASGSDPDGDALTYSWDLNSDGIFDDATGASPTLSWSQLLSLGIGDDGTYTVTVIASDGQGGKATDTATITVANAAPTVQSFVGPAEAVSGQVVTFTGLATDPAGANDPLTYSWAVYKDGSSTPYGSGSGIGLTTFSFLPQEVGSYEVMLTVDDGDGGTATDTAIVTVKVAALLLDPYGDGLALFVGGTTGADHVHLGSTGIAGEVGVTVNGVSAGIFTPTSGRLVVYAQAGDDNVQVAGGITYAAWLYGGDGKDRLKGGNGDDVLLGEAGDDLLVGGSGRDLIVGGTGSDRIVGNPDDDILIAGSLLFGDGGAQATNHAISDIMGEWTSTRSYEERIANLSGQGTTGENGLSYLLYGTTIIEDGSRDILTGSAGEDWFFFGSSEDKATDLNDEAFANDLDWILEC